MKTRTPLACSFGFLVTLAGCGQTPAPAPRTAAPTPMTAPVQLVTAVAPATPGGPGGSALTPRPGATLTATIPGRPALIPSVPSIPAPVTPSYETKGRRDPFDVLDQKVATTGLAVASTRLTGIIRNGRASLALVETADGIGYILRPGDVLGDGRLLQIGADNAVFTVALKPGSPSDRVVLRLAVD